MRSSERQNTSSTKLKTPRQRQKSIPFESTIPTKKLLAIRSSSRLPSPKNGGSLSRNMVRKVQQTGISSAVMKKAKLALFSLLVRKLLWFSSSWPSERWILMLHKIPISRSSLDPNPRSISLNTLIPGLSIFTSSGRTPETIIKGLNS